ncbi:hypothetical protein K504DRAFT_499379 [Pleomassaria siparia CBS 279.74]|uniref:Uncharacterized protein n=1 Tax=Pleomassaria siparia CBS 279.74 TaxID=1314801 RepID=A0A6G1KIA3_9PLEO|nr:hypothetical protein K504DRAFT_499379 [Pleomassaria siparia CBS 279.74]
MSLTISHNTSRSLKMSLISKISNHLLRVFVKRYVLYFFIGLVLSCAVPYWATSTTRPFDERVNTIMRMVVPWVVATILIALIDEHVGSWHRRRFPMAADSDIQSHHQPAGKLDTPAPAPVTSRPFHGDALYRNTWANGDGGGNDGN